MLKGKTVNNNNAENVCNSDLLNCLQRNLLWAKAQALRNKDEHAREY